MRLSDNNHCNYVANYVTVLRAMACDSGNYPCIRFYFLNFTSFRFSFIPSTGCSANKNNARIELLLKYTKYTLFVTVSHYFPWFPVIKHSSCHLDDWSKTFSVHFKGKENEFIRVILTTVTTCVKVLQKWRMYKSK